MPLLAVGGMSWGNAAARVLFWCKVTRFFLLVCVIYNLYANKSWYMVLFPKKKRLWHLLVFV